MPKKKKSTSKVKAGSTRVRRRKAASHLSQKAKTRFSRSALPMLLSGILITGLVVLAALFYQNIVGSDFFKVHAIDVRGNLRTPSDDIRKLVADGVEKPGVWRADLSDLKVKIEKFPYIKSASVSRELPAGIRIDVVERVPTALIHLSSGNFLVDEDGAVLERVQSGDQPFPFVLQGWDEGKTDIAGPANLARLKLYKKMLDEWKQFDLLSRVRQVDLADLKEPKAVIVDSGKPISISLSKDDLGKSLKIAVEAVSGKGAKVKSVNSEGVSPIITYMDF